jgi:hypothetical protein
MVAHLYHCHGVEHHSVWLGETEDGDLKELLKPYLSEEMKIVANQPTREQPKEQ